MEQKYIVALIVTFIFAVLIVLGSIAASIWDNRNVFVGGYDPCPTLSPNATQFMINPDFLGWYHAKSDCEGDACSIVQKCPSSEHDVCLYNEFGQLVSCTDGKIFSLVSRVDLYNCRGERFGISQAASVLGNLYNGNGVSVSWLLTDLQGTILAYVEALDFFRESMTFKDPSGNTIATASRDAFSFQWIIQYTPNPYLTREVLVLSLGSKKYRDITGNNDLCNSYFRGVAILFLVIACVLGFALVMVIGKFFYDRFY
jgi:hypothetical protein